MRWWPFRRWASSVCIGEHSWPVPDDLAAAVAGQSLDLKAEIRRLESELAGLRGEAGALAHLLEDVGRGRDAERLRADGEKLRADDAERRLAAALESQEQERRDTITKLAPESLRAGFAAKTGEELRGSLSAVVDFLSTQLAAEANADRYIAKSINYFKPGSA